MADDGSRNKAIVTPGSAKRGRRLLKKIASDEFMAAAIGDVEWLKQSLKEARGKINHDKNGLTALHLAAIHGRLDCIKLLLDKFNFDINLPSSTGWRAIHLAISNQTGKRSLQCLQYLLDRGADSSVLNDDGITPVHQAASEGHVQCLKVLIDLGADINSKDCRGHTPLDLSKLWGHQKCARILASEVWHKDKDNVAKEMHDLKKSRMQQALQDFENEDKKMSESVLNKQKSKDSMSTPHSGSNMHVKTEDKSGKSNILRENSKNSLQKPNSKVLQKPEQAPEKSQVSSAPSEKTSRRQDSIPSQKIDMTSINKSITDDSKNIDEENPKQVKNKKAHNLKQPWRYALIAPSNEYIENLKDDYPRDMFTMMPVSGPKYYDGKHISQVANKHSDEEEDDKTKSGNKKEVSIKGSDHRPMAFKCCHVDDVQTVKKYDDTVTTKTEAGIHLCYDDISSRLFQGALSVPVNPPSSADNNDSDYVHSDRLSTVLSSYSFKRPTTILS